MKKETEKSAVTYEIVFFNRLFEAGIKLTDLNIRYEKNDKITIEVIYNELDSMYKFKVLAVQGLIYHFKNREWIDYDNYMYIAQGEHTIRFTK